MSAVIVGSFSWPALSSVHVVPLTMIRIAWYSSLILAIAAVAVGLQQSVFLIRVGSLLNCEFIIQELLSFRSPAGQHVPRWDQVFIWQAAVGLLEWSIFLWVGGYIVFIGDLTKLFQEAQERSDQVVSSTFNSRYIILITQSHTLYRLPAFVLLLFWGQS